MRNLPKVSIVTVVYNGATDLEATMQSVLQQTYSNIEYIIVDGKSTDGTLDIIQNYEKDIDIWLSEADKGIYDAMNKGIHLATGDWVNFMNVGDRFISNDVIETMFSSDIENADMLYGNYQVDFQSFKNTFKPLPIEQLWKGMTFNHQCLFAKTSLMKESGFDTTFKIAADFKFIYAQFLAAKQFKYVNKDVAFVVFDGFSTQQIIKLYKERFLVLKALKQNTLKRTVYYQLMIARMQVSKWMHQILPSSLKNYLWERRVHSRSKKRDNYYLRNLKEAEKSVV